ncbi:processed acidic surface protein [Metabacillus crassostreae]|uniref:processed acidic surface protein n=1 Tax=Metabacillus crassostreae TaxID=929098 RepID=UPI00195C48B7|nr:processed acidic surface protein [Metabacillus crassostreae]MBM7605609.1 processed acidic surface protein [Metabacillus crassostreae]
MKKVISSLIAIFILFIGSIPAFAIEKVELEEYANSIGITIEDLEDYLSYDGYSLDDFVTLEELVDYVGEPVTADSLQQLLSDYNMTEAELTDLLIGYGELEEGESIEDVFVYIYDVESIILLDLEAASDEMMVLFEELGLTEEEVNRLFEHLEPLFTNDPNFEDELLKLADRMIAFEEFESVDELSSEQIAEIFNVFNELQNLLQVNVKYYLVSDGVKTSIDLNALLNLQNPKQGTSLLIEVFNLDGSFLLDVLFTPDMIGSDVIKETGKDIKETKEASIVVNKTEIKETVKGAKLPKTAGHYPEWILGGILLMGIAVIIKKKIGSVQ